MASLCMRMCLAQRTCSRPFSSVSFRALIVENNQQLQRARQVGEQAEVAFYTARGRQLVDDEIQRSRRERESLERRRAEKRQYAEWDQVIVPPRQEMWHGDNVFKNQANAAILSAIPAWK
eukprot:TRINITY_DN50095_c0_g1_i1.p1 TRINITY_DN50095_c0_g1~~TRINITY_DN50095_c0_g1_i1.p1  ORF type:complete len:139 (-),score=16.44 TRINITY_DN50095_c0_g1_i1:40-399(-)